MKYPNTRYSRGGALEHWVHVYGGKKEVAKILKRDERTLHNWLEGNQPTPWWAPEILRLMDIDYRHRMREMGCGNALRKLGVVSGSKILPFTQTKRCRDVNAADEAMQEKISIQPSEANQVVNMSERQRFVR